MTFPDQLLNEPSPSLEMAEERRLQARQTLAQEIARKCQDVIQNVALIASDDSLPDNEMRGEYFHNQVRTVHTLLRELDILGSVFCAPVDERDFWAYRHREGDE